MELEVYKESNDYVVIMPQQKTNCVLCKGGSRVLASFFCVRNFLLQKEYRVCVSDALFGANRHARDLEGTYVKSAKEGVEKVRVIVEQLNECRPVTVLWREIPMK